MFERKLYRADMLRCVLCSDAPCSKACGKLDVSATLRSIWFDDEKAAASCFPAQNPCTGCQAPCEEKCVRPYEVPIRALMTQLHDEVKPELEIPLPEDEYRLGQTAKKLHSLQGYHLKSPDSQGKKRFYEWFRDRPFVREFDAILNSIPDFEKLDQCFIHSDMGPHNAMLSRDGRVVFIDLDDSGIGSRYLDLGWPFIMQFVDFNHETEEMRYRFDLAESFLKGYYGEKGISREEYDLIFYGAEQMHISYMQSYGPYAVDSLWKILNYGMNQKEKLWKRLYDISYIR